MLMRFHEVYAVGSHAGLPQVSTSSAWLPRAHRLVGEPVRTEAVSRTSNRKETVKVGGRNLEGKGLDTLAVHGGANVDPSTGAITPSKRA
jgi:hypothetical protein